MNEDKKEGQVKRDSMAFSQANLTLVMLTVGAPKYDTLQCLKDRIIQIPSDVEQVQAQKNKHHLVVLLKLVSYEQFSIAEAVSFTRRVWVTQSDVIHAKKSVQNT